MPPRAPAPPEPNHPTARHVKALAREAGVQYVPTFGDHWAAAVTRLAGDEVTSDATDDLLVALTRAGKLSPSDMVRLVMAHHREPRLMFDPFGDFATAGYLRNTAAEKT